MKFPRRFGIRFPSVGPRRLGFSGITGVLYDLQDEFAGSVPAGSVNGTLATDGINPRTVMDTNSKLSIGSGVASFATGGAGYGDPGLWYPAQARTAGKVLVAKINITSTNDNSVGFDTDAAGSSLGGSFSFTGTSIEIPTVNATVVGSFSASIDYYIAVVLRAAGGLYLIKGGAFGNWTLLWADKTITDASLYPTISGRTATVFTADFIRIPQSTISFAPLASDSFNRANGAIGAADGAGTEETAPSQAWSNKVGAYTIATNKAVGSTLSGGIAVSTLSGSINNNAFANVTRAGGDAGVVVRWVDANNYVRAIHNGTNAQLVKVVAGTPSTLVNAAATYSAGADIGIICDGTSFSLYYNNVLIGAPQTISDAALQTSALSGLYTSDATNSFDNFRTWDRSGVYGALDQFVG